MEEIRYKKFKGWNGTVYRVRMTHEEAEARRKLGLLIGILTGIIVCFCLRMI